MEHLCLKTQCVSVFDRNGEGPYEMLERPAIDDEALASAVGNAYGMDVGSVSFLPIGFDIDTAVFQLTTQGNQCFFLKLRKGGFDQSSVAIPRYLFDQGISGIAAPLRTKDGQLHRMFDRYRMMVYPYLQGENGFDVPLSKDQWGMLGQTLHAIHNVPLPDRLRQPLRRETFSPIWRDLLSWYLQLVSKQTFADVYADKLASLLCRQQVRMTHLVTRAAKLFAELIREPPPYVLCHGDIHGGNVMVDGVDVVNVVDWDTLLLAPKERDLMFVGGGVGGVWNDPQEVQWFYEGYGGEPVNMLALVYYRYERIAEDTAVTCQALLDSQDGGADREQYYCNLVEQFDEGNVLDIAEQTDALFNAVDKNR